MPALSTRLLALLAGGSPPLGVAFGALGSLDFSTTSINVPYVTGITAGQLLVLMIANKYPSNGPATPSGWTLVANAQASGGAGSAGVGTGPTICTVFTKEATGAESGSVAVVASGSSLIYGRMVRYTHTGTLWDVAAANGADAVQNTSWSATMGSDPGLMPGDMVLAVNAVNNTVAASAEAISAAGISAWGTVVERVESGATTLDNIGIIMSEHPVTTGVSTAAPVFTMTPSANLSGSTVLLRLRDTNPNAQDTGARFRLLAQASRDVAARLGLAIAGPRDGALRFGLALQAVRDSGVRLQLLLPGTAAALNAGVRAGIGIQSRPDAALRYRLIVGTTQDAGLRFGLVAPTTSSGLMLL